MVWNPYNEITTITYDGLDREQSKTLANSQITSHVYDQAGRETVLSNTLLSSGAVLTAHTATYDPVGNLINLFDTIIGAAPGISTYSYAAAGQIYVEQSSALSALNTYSWDPVGNGVGATYNGANAILVGPGDPTTTYTHDAAGNLTGCNCVIPAEKRSTQIPISWQE